MTTSEQLVTQLANLFRLSNREAITVRELDAGLTWWRRVLSFWMALEAESSQRLSGKRSLRLFDFDIVYASLTRSDRELPWMSMTPYRSLQFPATAEYVFRNSHEPFTLPTGSRAELLNYLSKHSRQTAHVTRAVVSVVEEISRLAKATYSSANEVLELDKRLDKNLGELLEAGTRSQELAGILNHPQHVDWHRLGASVDPADVKELRQRFNGRRANLDVNNYFDALNVSLYYEFHRRSQADAKWAPVFATSTRVILELENVIGTGYESSVDWQGRPYIVPTHYLTFATAVERFAEYDNRRVNLFARQGFRKATDFVSIAMHWLTQARQSQRPDGRLTPDIIRALPLTGDVSAHGRAVDDALFSTAGHEFVDAARADLQVSQSRLATITKMRDALKAKAPHATSAVAAVLEVAEKEADFIEPLLRAALVSDITATGTGSSAVERLLESKVAVITPLAMKEPALMLSALETGESILCRRDGAQPLVWWRYRVPPHDLVKAAVTFLRSQGDRTTVGEPVRLFCQDQESTTDVDTLVAPSGLETLMSAEYVSISRAGWCVSFDVVPFPGSAPGLEIAIRAPTREGQPSTRASCDALATLHRASSVVSLQPRLMSELLAEVLDRSARSILEGVKAWNDNG